MVNLVVNLRVTMFAEHPLLVDRHVIKGVEDNDGKDWQGAAISLTPGYSGRHDAVIFILPRQSSLGCFWME